MPIGDLLAQISGGKTNGQSPGALAAQRSGLASKRKADDELRRDLSKAPRSSTSTPTPTQPATIVDKAASAQRSLVSQTKKPAAADGGRGSYASAATKTAAPRLPAANKPNGDLAPKAAPKKGSFAEIMARGQRAQAVMGQVGKIQHKKAEKVANMRREEGRGGSAGPDRRLGGQKHSTGYTGSSRAPQRNGNAGPSRAGSELSKKRVGKTTGKAPVEEEQKKIKKAAQATTGYAGTARPKPGHSTKKDTASRGGALLNGPAHRPKTSSRYDDYDEELDDFIEYDDEEDEGGPRYGYASDGSSDMEAGLDELDDEEQRAERIARREDIEEQRIEMNLKMAKEERKRKALEALRANRKA